jgi:hypothetical protein
MRPAFRLEADGADRTAELSDRLMSIRVTDAAGVESDEVELQFDNRGRAIEAPRKGAVLALWIGWEGREPVYQGRFTVSGRSSSGPARVLTIKAKAADMRASLKAAKSRSWRGTTVGALVGVIAGEHGLKAAVAADLAAQAVPHRDQANESDLHFVTRLAKEMGAVAAPKDGKLVFAPRGRGQSASGRSLAAVTFTPADLLDWSADDDDRADTGSVKARWRDLKAAKTKTAKAGSDAGPAKTLRRTHRSEAEAKAAAKAAHGDAKRASKRLTLKMVGRPELTAETPIVTTGLDDIADGRWPASKVEHSIDWSSGGFTTTVSAEPETPGEGAGA